MNKKDMPQGFAMALSQNKQALFYFSTLDTDEQNEICQRVTSLTTKEQIKEFVKGLETKSVQEENVKRYT